MLNPDEWLKSKERNSNYCLECGKEIVGKDRFVKKFCSHSSSETFNNKKDLNMNVIVYIVARF